MGKGYLTDTNVVIDFAAQRLPGKGNGFVADVIDSNPYISVINKIELLGFSVVSDAIIEFVESAEVIPLNDEVTTQTIALRKKHKIKLADAVIAATAIQYDLELITRNVADFKKIAELPVIDPYNM